MGFATILLHLDDDPRAAVRLDFAVALAQRHSSHLVGLSCHRPSPFREGRSAGILGGNLQAMGLSRSRQLASQREQNFRSRCEELGWKSFDSMIEEDEPARALVARALCCDLAVIGQPDPGDPDRMQRRQVVDHVVMRNAHPTLLIPHVGRFLATGDVVLVGWDGSHECARAVSDARPFLEASRVVHVIEFDRSAGNTGHIDQTRIEPVRRWLRRHASAVHAGVRFAVSDIGNAMLSYAADINADLLVMGAWGHARWRERLIGGTTNTILDTMTLPVFMSH